MFIYMFNNHPLTIDPCQGNIILSIYLCSITTHYNMLDMLETVWVIGTLIWGQPTSKGLDHVYSKNSRLVHLPTHLQSLMLIQLLGIDTQSVFKQIYISVRWRQGRAILGICPWKLPSPCLHIIGHAHTYDSWVCNQLRVEEKLPRCWGMN